MAIQDLINEVNSIQTKKQSIKEAITAKGVTSEGKLSKFADEIKQISTGEPYWCVLNRYRLDNGKEGVCARTNLDGIIGSVVASNSQNQLIEIYPDGYVRTINGSAFSKKEQGCYFIEPFNPISDGFNNIDNTYRIADSYMTDKVFTFTDFKNYNQYLRPYKENYLVNHNAVYISTTCKDGPRFGDITDKLDTNNSSLMFYPNGTSEPLEYVTKIDSTTFIQMAKSEDFSKVGFIKIGNESPMYINLRCERIFGKKKNGRDYSRLLHTIYNNTDCYNSLPLGNYMWLSGKDNILIAVFVGINYIVDINGNKKKNIEIYPYIIFDTRDFNINSYRNGDAIELYLNISEQGQKQLQVASSIKVFRRQVLAANGTPEPRASNFLTGSDALLQIEASKTVNGRLPFRNATTNLFKYNQDTNTIFRYQTATFEGGYISASLVEDISSNKKITGFIRLNDDSNTMFPIELEKAPDEVKNNSKIRYYPIYNAVLSCIAPNGMLLDGDNRMVVFIKDIQNNIICFYVKKGNDYITNNSLSATSKNTQLYLTTDAETQKYLTTKSLSKVWTEVQDVLAHKEDYEAYRGD